VTSTHRGHGHYLAKGGSLRGLMAELYGKATGCCRGKGGSMHIADLAAGYLGANGVLTAGLALACGVGLSARLRRTDQVALAFFGDGAANRGPFHESVNLAALWRLPVVFLCENNGWASSTPFAGSTAGGSIAARAAGYGIAGVTVDGGDAWPPRGSRPRSSIRVAWSPSTGTPWSTRWHGPTG
jgi:acetoin:2,6-dichlorophenolindophenol oxidoreductase subunit alpha